MKFASFLLGLLLAAMPAAAQPVALTDTLVVDEAYVWSAYDKAKSAAVYFTLTNKGTAPDRLLSVRTEAAKSAQLHRSVQGDNGVMKMRPMAEGLALPPGESATLTRGGSHLMLMGVDRALPEGAEIRLELTFEAAGTVVLSVPVDRSR